jgi:iron complex transport system ATP-binding protein
VSVAHLHVICGGGTGSQLLRKLHERGYRLSAGPLSELDDDARTARDVGAELILVPSLAAPSSEALDRAKALLSMADAVILTPFAVGRANLTSLTLVTDVPPEIPVFLVLGGDFARRDYTGGEATALYNRLRTRAAALPRSVADLLPLLADVPAADR